MWPAAHPGKVPVDPIRRLGEDWKMADFTMGPSVEGMGNSWEMKFDVVLCKTWEIFLMSAGFFFACLGSAFSN